MSVARGYGINGKSYYTNISKPIDCNLNFIVDSTNGNGLGIRSLKSNGFVDNVFMHTTATPGANNGHTNPNPAVGYCMVQFKNNFNYYLGGPCGIIPPPASSGVTSTTAGNVYIIQSVGSTTLAQWQAAGLPAGLVPTVNQAFVATATGAVGGSGTMYTPGVNTITSFSVVGDPNQTIALNPISPNGGAIVIVQFLAATNSSTTTLVAANPANNSVVSMCFRFDGSSVTVDGL